MSPRLTVASMVKIVLRADVYQGFARCDFCGAALAFNGPLSVSPCVVSQYQRAEA